MKRFLLFISAFLWAAAVMAGALNFPGAGHSSSSSSGTGNASTSADNNWSATQTFASSVTVKGAGGIGVTYGISAATGAFSGTVTAGTFSGSGASLTTISTTSLNWSSTPAALDLVTVGTGGQFTPSTPLTNVMQTTSTDTVTASKVFSGTTTISGYLVYTSSNITVADNGNGGTAAAYTLDVNAAGKSRFQFTCSDAQGCAITMSENGMNATNVVSFCAVNVSASNSLTWSDTSGVSELGGAYTAGPLDYICMDYVQDRWIETNRSNN